MSLVDDHAAERYSAIEDARARVAYGKHFPALELAKQVTALRDQLLKEYGTLSRVIEALVEVGENDKGLVMFAHQFAISLLQVALIYPKGLCRIGEAFSKLAEDGAVDIRVEALITAYESCEFFPPDFAELKNAFIVQFGKARWFKEPGVRKTLKIYRLPLREGRRGRPPRSRIQLKSGNAKGLDV